MKSLFVTAGVFVLLMAGAVTYLLTVDARHEYDFKLVLPVDARQMPNVLPPPKVASREDAVTASPITAGSAETPRELLEIDALNLDEPEGPAAFPPAAPGAVGQKAE
jgi:hypothetical protein